MAFKKWFCNHPINKQIFRTNLQKVRTKSYKNFVLCKTKQDLLKYWSYMELSKFDLNLNEIRIRSGGIGNVYKAKHNLWHSKKIINLYLGINEQRGVIMVTKIRARMKMVYNLTETKEQVVSNVMLTQVNDDEMLQNIPNMHQFSQKLRCMFVYYMSNIMTIFVH